jgi:hypothetical protein
MYIQRIYIDTPDDMSPDVSWLEQTPAQLGSLAAAVANRRRLKAYYANDWWLIGVQVCVEITMSTGAMFTLRSPGVWGVESDAPRDYVESIAREEFDSYLSDDLGELGFTSDGIEAALAQVSWVDPLAQVSHPTERRTA